MKLFRSVGYNLLGIGHSSFLGLVILAALGRWLPSSQFGLYTYMQQIVNISLVLCTMGSGFVLSHYYAAESVLPRVKIFQITALGNLGVALAATLIVLRFAGTLVPVGAAASTLRWGVVLLVPIAAKSFYVEALRAEGRFRQRALVESAGACLRLLAVAVLAFLSLRDVRMVFLAFGTMFMVQAVVTAPLLTVRKLGFPDLKEARHVYRVVGRKTGAYMLASGLNITIPVLVFFYLGRLAGIDAVGRFSYLYFFSFLLARVGEAFTLVLLPLASQEGDRGLVSTRMWQANFALAYMVIPLSVLCFAFRGPLTSLVFNQHLSGVEGAALGLILIAFSIKMVSANVFIVLSGTGYVRDVLWVAVATSILNAALAWWPIIQRGVLGAALTFAAVYLVQFMLLMNQARLRGIDFQLFGPFQVANTAWREMRRALR